MKFRFGTVDLVFSAFFVGEVVIEGAFVCFDDSTWVALASDRLEDMETGSNDDSHSSVLVEESLLRGIGVENNAQRRLRVDQHARDRGHALQ
jgi:hypothetical protein